MAVNRLSALKFLELCMAVACMILHYTSLGEQNTFTIMLTSGTFVGFTIILSALFVSYVINAPLHRSIDTFFSLVGCVMFITSGILIIEEWEGAMKTDVRRSAIAKGSLAIVNGLLFLFDVFFTYRTSPETSSASGF